MQLTDAHVTLFKSIDDSNSVAIDPKVTSFVGQNESGKTAFLQALHKAKAVEGNVEYNVVEDYPRKGLIEYQKKKSDGPATVVRLTYRPSDNEIKTINADLGFDVVGDNFRFTHNHHYGNDYTISIQILEAPYIAHLLQDGGLSKDVVEKVGKANSVKSLISLLEKEELGELDAKFLAELKSKFDKIPDSWDNALKYYVWKKHLQPVIPEFLYFDEYKLLPGKVNLPALQQRVASNTLTGEDRTVLGLLRLAGVELKDLLGNTGYEEGISKLEGFSNSVTDKVFDYWTQNQSLEVVFDIRADPTDAPPFNNGNNLYIRIKNQRHRVTVPFDQRSKGFIWFFSFIVWFDSITELVSSDQDLILLLDEPGLNLHALAQKDFLRYIDDLSEAHQILYTTHSPFMIHGDRLHQVRMVEDKEKLGTKVTSNLSGSDPKTLFPLQAALGYTIAQNLFISPRNLLVEGPADLVYLQYFSSLLEQKGRPGLRDDITIVPVGGLDKLATFVALLGANQLEITVLHDYSKKPDPRLEELARDKLIQKKQVLNYAMFRSDAGKAEALLSTDVEDMMPVKLYLKLFNDTFKAELSGVELKEDDLPPGDRIVERIERYLKASDISIRPTGGYNHYRPATYLASHPFPLGKVDIKTLDRFEKLFREVNALFSEG